MQYVQDNGKRIKEFKEWCNCQACLRKDTIVSDENNNDASAPLFEFIVQGLPYMLQALTPGGAVGCTDSFEAPPAALTASIVAQIDSAAFI